VYSVCSVAYSVYRVRNPATLGSRGILLNGILSVNFAPSNFIVVCHSPTKLAGYFIYRGGMRGFSPALYRLLIVHPLPLPSSNRPAQQTLRLRKSRLLEVSNELLMKVGRR
jgi:hypothetical protein